MICPYCGSSNVELTGLTNCYLGDDFQCNDCGKDFYEFKSKDNNLSERIKKYEIERDDDKIRVTPVSRNVLQDIDYFLNRLKGALMYVGGNFENCDFKNMSAYDLIDSCFRNGVELTCCIKDSRGKHD